MDTQSQFLADQLEQMDLAIDQLALKDRNFDRFAIMLIDNVVELTLHRYAQEYARRRSRSNREGEHSKAIDGAVGQHFEPKVKLAKVTGMLSLELSDSLVHLHTFRNTAHHRGLRHEGILHALALFYFRGACSVLGSFKSSSWSSGSRDLIPHRAMKYLGRPSGHWSGYSAEAFHGAWERLGGIADTMGDTLVSDLHADMKRTIESVDAAIQFVADNSPVRLTRTQAVLDAQAWALAWTDEGKTYAAGKLPQTVTVAGYIKWLASNFPWPSKQDPIPSWRRRLGSLKNEKSPHAALKKYCDFENQTEGARAAIFRAAGALEDHLQNRGR